MALFVGAMEVSLYALGEGILVTFVLLCSVKVKSEETCFGLQKKQLDIFSEFRSSGFGWLQIFWPVERFRFDIPLSTF